MSTTTKAAHTPGAMRAAKLMAISPKVRQLALGIILREEFSNELAEIIDRETAAPEMLERLEQIRDWANNHAREMMHVGPSSASDFLHDAIGETRELVKDIEAAIQKARGGQ